MQTFYRIVFFSFTLTLVACNDSHQTKSKKATLSSSEQTISITDSSVELSYSFKTENCTTGKQSFDSAEKLCKGLQNTTLNNNCALSARQQYFTQNCPSQTFSSFDNAQEALSEFNIATLDVKSMQSGDANMDVLKTSPVQAMEKRSELSIFSCSHDLREASENKINGFKLLNNSKAVIIRDLDYTFKDGSRTSELNPYVQFECSTTSNSENDSYVGEGIDKSDLVEKNLEVNHAIITTIITSPEGYYPTQSALLYISCMGNTSLAIGNDFNGISLLKGSKMVIKRDINYAFGDGSRADSNTKSLLLISCEE